MERLGLGYAAVKALNPRAVYASVKGFGSDGPYSGFKCFEPVAQATSGAISVTGEGDGPPSVNGADVGDFRHRHDLAIAILAVLRAARPDRPGSVGRGRDAGGGAEPDAGQVHPYARHRKAARPQRQTDRRPAATRIRSAAGCGANSTASIMIPPDNQEMFAALAEVISQLRPRDRRTLLGLRRERRRGGIARDHRWTGQARGHAGLRRERHPLPARSTWPRCWPTRICANAHSASSSTIRRAAATTTIGCPLRLSDSPFAASPAPLLGEHTEAVLTSLAGYSVQEVRQLRDQGIV